MRYRNNRKKRDMEKLCDTVGWGLKGWLGIWERVHELQVKDLTRRWLEDEPQLWGGRRQACGEGIVPVMDSGEAPRCEAVVMMEGCRRGHA